MSDIWTCAATEVCIRNCNCIWSNIKDLNHPDNWEAEVYNRLEGFRVTDD